MQYRTFVRTVGKWKAVGLYEINALDVVFPQNTAGISRRHCVLRAKSGSRHRGLWLLCGYIRGRQEADAAYIQPPCIRSEGRPWQ